MDVEKYASSKPYQVFDWIFKLIVWNIISLLIIILIAFIPIFSYYKVKDINDIKNVEIINDEVIVTQNNDNKTNIGNLYINGEATHFTFKNNKLIFYIDEYQFKYTFNAPKYNLSYNESEINKISISNGELIIDSSNGVINLGDLYKGNIDLDLCKINFYNNLIIGFDNSFCVCYGNKVKTQQILLDALLLLTILFVLFAFIPLSITIFRCIKISSENGSGGAFGLYFEVLLDSFINIYKLDIITSVYSGLLVFGLYYYYNVLLSSSSFFTTFIYNIILVCTIIDIMFILNIPMTVAYFKMHTYSIFRFTLLMTFRRIGYSILYVIIFILPLILSLLLTFLIPIWCIIGLSLSLMIMYMLSSKKYHKLVIDFNNEKREQLEYEKILEEKEALEKENNI